MKDFLDTFNFEEYANYILANQSPERHGDEILAFCPLHDDQNTKSLNFNVRTGVFKCHGCQVTGNVITFHAAVRNLPRPIAVQELKMFQKNRPPRPEHLAKPKEKPKMDPIKPEVIENMHQALLDSPATIAKLKELRGWDIDTIKRFKIGWHQGHQRITIPIKEGNEYVDVRLYTPRPREISKDKDGNPVFEPKIKSWAKGYGGTRLFPDPAEAVIEKNGERWLILVAGEPDCLCAWSHGIPCVTVTGGEGSWSPDWNDEYGIFSGATNVMIIYDNDETGKRGTLKVASNLLTYGPDRKVTSIVWPDGFHQKGDITDFFVKDGKTIEDFRALDKMTWGKDDIDKSMVMAGTKVQQVNEARREEKEKEEETSDVSGIERTPGCYVAIRWAGDPPEEKRKDISNFVLDYDRIEDLGSSRGYLYYVKPTIKGTQRPANPMTPEEKTKKNSVNAWLSKYYKGATFYGNQAQLDLMWALEDGRQDPMIVKRPVQSGYFRENNIWIFRGCMVKDCQVYPIDPKTNMAKVVDTYYAPRGFDKENPDRLDDGHVPDPNFRMQDQEIKAARERLIELLPQNLGGMWAYLLLGWAAAVAYYPEIMKSKRRNMKFPLLFISGPAESGKNTMGEFIMSHFGLSESVCRSLGSSTTIVGIERSMAYYGALPTWIDEYRTSVKDIDKVNGVIRSAFDGTGALKGTTDVDKGKIAYVNGTLLITGEASPEDQATVGRCCLVQLRKTKLDKTVYPAIYELLDSTSGIFIDILKRKTPDQVASFLNKITEYQRELVETFDFDARLAGIYAVVTAGFTELYNPDDYLGVNTKFKNWIIEEGGRFQEIKKAEANANQFLADLPTICDDPNSGVRMHEHVKTGIHNGENVLLIKSGSFRRIHGAWRKYLRNQGLEPWSEKAIRNALKDSDAFISNSVPHRFKVPGSAYDKTARAIALSIARLPEEIKEEFRDLKWVWSLSEYKKEDETE